MAGVSVREEFDLLIVGAGPAGSFAAERLARRGARVALFDGRAPDDPKACGGGVTSKALKAWPHLLEAAGRTVEEVEMFSPEGAPQACRRGVTSPALKAWPHLLEPMGRTVAEVELYSPAGARVRLTLDAPFDRSAERRVGREGRSRRSPYHY